MLDGQDITRLSITERANLGISYAFQQPVRFKGLRVKDLLSLAAGRNTSVNEACSYLSEVGLCARDYIDREVNASLSGGELKRIEIAMVLARGTKLSIFDEPEAGIDLWSFQNLIRVFEKMYEQTRGSILIISHQERILNIADTIVVVKDGDIVRSGPRAELLPALLGSADAANPACDVLTSKMEGGVTMDAIEKKLLHEVAELDALPVGAYNIRANGQLQTRNTTANIDIVSKDDKPGIDIYIKPGYQK